MVTWLLKKFTRIRAYWPSVPAWLSRWGTALAQCWDKRREVTAWGRHAFSNSSVLAGITITAILAILFLVPIFTSPFHWLPEAKDSLSLLGPLLGAQAAVAALTLAVTVFVVQGVSNKDDADDRTYREYVRRSRAEWVLWGSLGAAAITAAVLVGHRLTSGTPAVLDAAQGLPNLTLVAVAALFGNLVLPGVLFRHAIRLARPDQWRALRLELNRRDVRDAVHVFLERNRRGTAALEADLADWADLFPDLGEGSANEAIQSLLGDARRTMDERRLAPFKRSLEAVKELVTSAMDEIEREGLDWSSPGSQPQWPPLRELGSNLDSFRDEVIRRGDHDYLRELLSLDHWLLANGRLRACGELFTVALEGYRRNYEIVRRVGSGELLGLFRDCLWDVADSVIYGAAPDEVFPYASQMVWHQERLLSDALHAGRPTDYEQLHRGFAHLLETIRLHWEVDTWPPPESAALFECLEQDYRIALMGLGGRAVLLAESATIADPNPYLDVGLGHYDTPEKLADDTACALADRNRKSYALWSEWEMEGARSGEARSVYPEQYPLTFFAVRLLELSAESIGDLDLQGRAKEVLGWFEANSRRLERHVVPGPDSTMDERREAALAALRIAVRRDEVVEESEVIRWPLSEDKIETFTREVRASAKEASFVSRFFDRAGALLYVSGDGDTAPLRFGRPPRLMGRGFFADVPEDSPTHYATPHGSPLGRGHAHDVQQLLCETLDEAPSRRASLDTPGALLQAIDNVVEELNPTGNILVLLTGDWTDVLVDLEVQEPQGYEPGWRQRDADRADEFGRYRGYPITRGRVDGERRLYVVEPAVWGGFVRARLEDDQDLDVRVEPISAERAQELLAVNPGHFPDEPDQASKLRKLQAHVVITVAARMEFRVTDPSRARRIVASD